MKLLLCTYLLIACVYCDIATKENDKTVENTKLEGASKIFSENVIDSIEDVNNKSEIFKEKTNQPQRVLKDLKGITEAPNVEDQSKTNGSLSKIIETDLKDPKINEDDILNNTTDNTPAFEDTLGTKGRHHRQHYRRNYKIHQNYLRLCHHNKHNSRQTRKQCYKLRKEAQRQKKLAKIIYPNGVPFKTTIPIDVPHETNMTFSRVIKARKTHDKKTKVWMKRLRKNHHYERRRNRMQIRRLKLLSNDIENTTEKLQTV